jgi:hypothetical protein
MPYDFAQGFNTGGYGSGFAGRQGGSRFANVYGYDDMGGAVSDRSQMAKINQQRYAPTPSPTQAPTPSAMPGPDFFSALAGLMGGGNPYGAQVAPAQGSQAQQPPQGYNMGQQIAQYNQYANRPTPIAGQAQFGGFDVPAGFGAQQIYGAQQGGLISKDNSTGGYTAGPASGVNVGFGYNSNPSSSSTFQRTKAPLSQVPGRSSTSRTNPLSNLPNGGGNGLFRRGGGGAL